MVRMRNNMKAMWLTTWLPHCKVSWRPSDPFCSSLQTQIVGIFSHMPTVTVSPTIERQNGLTTSHLHTQLHQSACEFARFSAAGYLCGVSGTVTYFLTRFSDSLGPSRAMEIWHIVWMSVSCDVFLSRSFVCLLHFSFQFTLSPTSKHPVIVLLA